MEPAFFGELFTILRIDWDIFGTLTFRGEGVSPGHAWSKVYPLFHRLAKYVRIPFGDLLTATRLETGRINGRIHLHFLAAGVGSARVRPLCRKLEKLWSEKVGGTAEIEPFDPVRCGTFYCTKPAKHPIGSPPTSMDPVDAISFSNAVFRLVAHLEHRLQQIRHHRR